MSTKKVGDGSIVIDVPKGIAIKELDGISLDFPSDHNRSYKVFVPPGEHGLVVEYFGVWKHESESGSLIKSGDDEPLNTVRWKSRYIKHNFSPKQRYRLNFNTPNGYEQAKSMRLKSPIWLESSDGQRISGNLAKKKEFSLLRRLQLTSDDDEKTLISPSSSKEDDFNTDDRLGRLQYWWSRADQDEREKFVLWLMAE